VPGLYYEYNKRTESGFFPGFRTSPLNSYSSYSSSFSAHYAGPVLDAAAGWKTDRLSLSVSAGIVPVFYFSADRSMKISPEMDPAEFSFSQSAWGGPYGYAGLACGFFNMVSLSLGYEVTALDYRIINLQDDWSEWITPEQEALSQTFEIEVILSVPLGSANFLSLGYGYRINTVTLDGIQTAPNKSHCFILGAERRFF
jgi:hypothetical protein